MKNFFRGNRIEYEDVLSGMKNLSFLYHLNYMEEEKKHVLSFLESLDDSARKDYICNNISLFNRTLNKNGLSTDSINNMFAYIGFLGLIENNFSLLQDLNMNEIVLLSTYVYPFITHKDYPENLRLPFLSEKKVLSTIIEREPNSLSLQKTILDSVDHSFTSKNHSGVESYISNLSDDEVSLLDESMSYTASKGIEF